jgi:hypothetical protein
MKLLKLLLPLTLCFLSLPSMASTTYYVATLYDDAGAPAPGATFTQTAVKTLAAGSAVAVTLTPVDLGNGDYSVAYDPAANGEAVAKFTPTLSGHTFTNGNALVKFVMTADSSQIAKISTNTADSPNTVTEQVNAASSATGIASANLILAKFLFDTSNFVKAATQTLPATAPAGYGGSGGGGGDPWTTLLPGPYGPGSAGFIVGNSLGVKATAVGTSPTLAQTQAMLAAQSTQTVTIVTGRKGQTVPLVVNFSGVIYTIPLNTPTVVPQSIYEILVNGGYAP